MVILAFQLRKCPCVTLSTDYSHILYTFLIGRWYLARRNWRSFVLLECRNTLFHLVQVIITYIYEVYPIKPLMFLSLF